MEDNCDSGSSEGEMDSSGDESTECDETDFPMEIDGIHPQRDDKLELSEKVTDGKKNVAFANDKSERKNSKSRKLSKQKAMDVDDPKIDKKDEKSRKEGVANLKFVNKSKLKPGDRRHSEPIMNLKQQDEAQRKISLQDVSEENDISLTKLGISDNPKHTDKYDSKNPNSKKDVAAEGKDDKGKQKTFWKDQRKNRRATQRKVQSNFWKSVLESIFQSGGLGDTRAGRAGLIYNPLRGLSLQQTFPISPLHHTTPNEERDFQGFHEAVEVQAKKLYLVDSGLTFNIPFPLLLRPQRAVDIYLTFDFSGRPSDFHEPFKEIILAEKWARLNSVPFPPVAEMAKKFLTEPLREIYVFENPNEEYCPVIIHFIIFNGQFREFKAPGIRRETDEEKQFADFKIFSDPEDTYSMFHFCYNHLQFNRLSQLMEFNTQLGMKIVRKCIKDAIQKKQSLLTRTFSVQKSSEYTEDTLDEDTEDSDDDIFYDAQDSLS
ncbi:hypothetical protein J437_LFUL008302 [Ladona fulva]|uniref:PLA2c domain-containing protein n=1 Tax=Ladona fulva TaxID=123851 RepID=A0A8K0P082_LADFU|nr:hypothetical protein J437_LFUL008302 [Ladona fulva]